MLSLVMILIGICPLPADRSDDPGGRQSYPGAGWEVHDDIQTLQHGPRHPPRDLPGGIDPGIVELQPCSTERSHQQFLGWFTAIGLVLIGLELRLLFQIPVIKHFWFGAACCVLTPRDSSSACCSWQAPALTALFAGTDETIARKPEFYLLMVCEHTWHVVDGKRRRYADHALSLRLKQPPIPLYVMAGVKTQGRTFH